MAQGIARHDAVQPAAERCRDALSGRCRARSQPLGHDRPGFDWRRDSRSTTPRLGGGKDGYGNFTFDTPRPMFAGWIGDTWKVGRRVSLNYGVRYDVAWEDLSPPGVTPTTVLVDSGLGVRISATATTSAI